jgi:hypothetical protein
MVIGMYYHMFPRKGEEGLSVCSCEWHKGALSAKAAAA